MNISNLLNPERVKDSASNSRPYTPAPLIRSPTSDQSLLDAETDSPPDFDSPSIIPSVPTRSHPVLQRTNGKPSARSTRLSALQREDNNVDDSSSLSSLDESDGEDRYEQLSDDDAGLEHSESEEELGPKRSSNSRGERATKRAKQAEIWSDEVEMLDDRLPPRQSTSRLEATVQSTRVQEGHVQQTSHCQKLVSRKHLGTLGYPVCHQCASKHPERYPFCTFKGIRWIPCNNVAVPVKGVATFESHVDDVPHFPHSDSFDQPFTPEIALSIKIAASRNLLPTMQLALRHAQRPNSVKVQLDLVTRAICDGCNTSIFCASYFCSDCGREFCLDCKEKAVITGGKMDEELKCRRHRNNTRKSHTEAQLLPFTRLHEEELNRIVKAMVEVQEQNPIVAPLAISSEKLDSYYGNVEGFRRLSLDESLPILFVPLHDLDPVLAARSPATPDPNHVTTAQPSVDSAAILAADQLFASLIARGEPIITAIDPRRWEMHYSPEQFIKEHGEDRCSILSNVTQQGKKDYVKNFFSEFGIERSITESKKIKDWPSSDDFKVAFRSKFDHYMDEIPRGSMTRRDGVLNLAAHAPHASNPPDLGPKGYFSQISDDNPGGSGSTKLHSDVADAINVMPFACDAEGNAGYAVWDMWRREDTDKLRTFLYNVMAEKESKVKGKNVTLERIRTMYDDPIHSEKHYMDIALRARLLKEHGVKSWRIVQSPGQAVFIPAGCAHQVCNFADCIKIASDFVSITNVPSCAKVTEEFRALKMEGKLWKSDVLQLKTLLFWAWRSAERFDDLSNPPAIDSLVAEGEAETV